MTHKGVPEVMTEVHVRGDQVVGEIRGPREGAGATVAQACLMQIEEIRFCQHIDCETAMEIGCIEAEHCAFDLLLLGLRAVTATVVAGAEIAVGMVVACERTYQDPFAGSAKISVIHSGHEPV